MSSIQSSPLPVDNELMTPKQGTNAPNEPTACFRDTTDMTGQAENDNEDNRTMPTLETATRQPTLPFDNPYL